MQRLKLIPVIGRTLGWRWMLFRLQYALAQRSGWQAWQWHAQPWSARPLTAWLRPGVPHASELYVEWRRENAGCFFFSELPSLIHYPAEAVTRANKALQGEWLYFEHTPFTVGFPPPWHENPLTHERLSPHPHWSQVSEGGAGDIKLIWEPSRFALAYHLVRAYSATRDERYPAAFWQLVEDWVRHNPPMLGPNWRCGQETSFRMMAWCFGLWGFGASPHTTPERVAALVHALAWQAERVELNIGYARSQKNNHAISEGLGLWMIGLLFPELDQAERWREHGRRVLTQEAQRQIFADGAYIQHSLNYHRVMLHDYLWALRLGEINEQPLPESVYDRVRRAAEFLFQVTDPISGRAPNYGANDGALVLPLSECDFTDYRPTLQACWAVLHHQRLYSPGPWDELAQWLAPQSLHNARTPAREPASLTATAGGYFTLRGPESWALFRCARYTDRPSQADQLHVDVWWRGVNVACDAGTYRYTDEGVWNNALSRTHVHNTLTINGRDQMLRAGKFLWLEWAQGTVRRVRHGEAEIVQGEHNGYARLDVTHRRAVVRLEDVWFIVDDVTGPGVHTARLHWLFEEAEHEFDAALRRLQLRYRSGIWAAHWWATTEAESTLVRAGAPDEATRGWHSRYYAARESALSLACEAHAALPIRFITVMGEAALMSAAVQPNGVQLECGPQRFEITLNPTGALEIIRSVSRMKLSSG